MVVVSLVVGVVLAVGSVPVAAFVSQRVLRAWKSPASQKQYWLDKGDHQIYIFHRDTPCYAHWESSIVPDGMYDSPGPDFQRPRRDPRPPYARRAYTGHVQSIVSSSAGWPCLAASGRALMDGTPARFWDEWFPSVTLGPLAWRVPVRPIWPGLIGNTAFYTAITLGLLVGVRVLRTRRRRARGRCVACNYEFGEGVSACPECGLAATA